ncbi:MAG TPA: FG-GAP-like repeat-containing protein, partial [Kofleriaceae bacterium]|nr:FG-GAP-like repeat-containing protein [Kofleriaceae bacterium]
DFNGDGVMDIGAIAAGVDGHSVDLLVALANASGGFAPMANWRHADGFGWDGMMPIAGDFNGDGRWDIGAIGAGVDGHSVDLLVATSTGSGFNAIGNWRHADGFGWNRMKPIAGDFNGDGHWDIGAIGAGVDGHSIDLLVATSTGSGFTAIGNWRHADGFGWNGLAPASL